MRHLALTIEYDGTNYAGWQVQPNGDSVQAALETAGEKLTGARMRFYGAGRTDAGVHARGQVATVRVESNIPTENFAAALNSRLPVDIVIHHAREVPENFSARHDAKMKLYRYTIANTPTRLAINRQYCWLVPFPLAVAAMQTAAQHFVGKHDFSSFTKSSGANKPAEDKIREVTACNIWTAPLNETDGNSAAGKMIYFDVQGRSFLYNMVRNLVGTLVEVGWGKIPADAIPEILARRDRSAAGQGAPAGGLCLEWIKYE